MRTFVADLMPEGLCHGHLLRAPLASARLRSFKAPPLPEGYVLLRARDIPGSRLVSCAGFAQPVLADPRVRYRGEPFALLGGPERDTLAQLAAAVQVEWEEEPLEAAPRWWAPGAAGSAPLRLVRGDPAAAFGSAQRVVEAEYAAGRQGHHPGVPVDALARGGERSVTVYTPTQDPFGLREALAAVLNLPPRRVRVVATALGNPLEGNLLAPALAAARAALLALACGRAVQVSASLEDPRCFSQGPGLRVRQQTALDREGNLLGVRVQLEVDVGAYAPEAEAILGPAAAACWRAYKVPSLEVQGRYLLSNLPPAGSFRAVGRSQAFFATELHAARLEEMAELDPFTWKKQALHRFASAEAPAGRPHGDAARASMEAVAALSDFHRKHASFASVKKRRRAALQEPFPLRGVGLAVACQERDDPGVLVGRAHGCAVKATLDTDKRLHLYTSLVDLGPGLHRMLAGRAAEILEMDRDRVIVEEVDTQSVVDTGPTTLGRGLGIGLPLVEQCCRAIKVKRIKSLPPITVRRSWGPGAGAPSAGGRQPPRGAEGAAAWGAAVVEVAVDPVGLEILCQGIWLAVAAGRLPEAAAVRRYLVGEALRALGAGLLPEDGIGPETGEAPPGQSPCPGRRSVPRLSQLPPVTVRLVEEGDPQPRGFEQLPYLTIPGALAAAVCQATGLYVDQIPITPEVLQECLEG